MDRKRQIHDRDTSVRIPVSSLLRQLEYRMLTSEKKNLQAKIISVLENSYEKHVHSSGSTSRYQNLLNRYIFTETLPSLLDDDLSAECLRTIVKRHQYHLLEEQLSEDLQKMSGLVVQPSSTAKSSVELPEIRSPPPVKPTTLLERVLSKHRMEKDIVVPTMTPEQTSVPLFTYEHDSGNKRNLPRQPELIRLLTDPEMNLGGKAFISLYGGTMGPPLIEKTKQQRPKRRRKILCQFCRMPPGGHQKWCIYYDTDVKEEGQPKLTKSYTDADIYAWKIPPKVEKPPPKIKKVKPIFDITKFKLDPDRPDYSTLHRDVYIRALEYTHARRVVKRAHDFMRQSTKPYVFSYYDNLDKPEFYELDKGMKHIFGKRNTNFTKFYTQEITKIKREQNNDRC